ncbi:uncharacterized protein [Dermacentor albipictus]|uniref:uncharacterized protein n=1 Tax=Dermacentor albipictus TaxID=60249 RepID=UPI0031FCEFC1
MQVSACVKLITGLTSAEWKAIFEISDAAQHLGLDAAQTELKLVAYCDRVVQRVTFFYDVEEWTPNECRQKASVQYSRQLRLVHFLVVAPEVLLEFTARCLELRSANLVVEPPALFRLLPQRLVRLKMRRWSLCEDGCYECWLEKDVIADVGTQCQLQTLKLDTTYAELVAPPLTADFMNNVSNGCEDQQRPCIHAIPKDAVGGSITNASTKLKTVIPGPRSSRYTPSATSLRAEASCSFVRPEGGLEQKAAHQVVRHAVVAAEVDSDAACRFLGGTRRVGAISLGSLVSRDYPLSSSTVAVVSFAPMCDSVR